jgi:hypothetical protein
MDIAYQFEKVAVLIPAKQNSINLISNVPYYPSHITVPYYAAGLGFRRPQADSPGSEFKRTRWMGHILEHVVITTDRRLDKTCATDRTQQVCFQQTAGDSAGPEGYVVQGLLGYFFRNYVISDEHAPPRFQHPGPFLLFKRFRWARCKITCIQATTYDLSCLSPLNNKPNERSCP